MSDEVYIDPNYIELFRKVIHEKLGIYITKEKDYLIESKISRLIKRSQYKNIAEFYQAIKNEDKQSIEDLIRYITTTHTYFFREPMHLQILRNDILVQKKENVKIWVAASSTGEEVYSIIIELLENGFQDFKVIASDINKDVIVHMKKGVYSKERVKNVTPDLMRKYFIDLAPYGHEGFVKVQPMLKNFFIAKKLNLVTPLRFETDFDYIFCRNVLIYFDKETQRQVLQNLLANLSDYGYLFVGHSESLLHLSEHVETVFSSVYNKKLEQTLRGT
ncbi:MAG: protein-glutamate O-methyltransferase CheR [Spirochaetales bacterium]|nr:protein-glutamate O-methyltransferase CheR [Spirochaetales bacterium]